MFTNLNKKLEGMDRKYYGPKKKERFSRRLFLVFTIVLILVIIPLKFAYDGLKEAQAHSKALASAYQNQNFGQLQKEASNIKGAISKVDRSLAFLFWLRLTPFLGGYVGDLKELSWAGVEMLTALEKLLSELKPYEEELGFRGQPMAGADRMHQAVLMLEKSLPHLDSLAEHFKRAADAVSDIDVEKYPVEFRGFKLREGIKLAKNIIAGSHVALEEGRETLDVAPSLLGLPASKNYLLLFQNDKEIRPTGGFLTASAFLKIDNGRIDTTTSDDIYRLDERLLATCLSKICPLTPPEAIVKYLPEVDGKPRKAWSMRDSNMSPDVPTSAKEFERMYQLLGEGLPYDGIIYIDSQVVEELIEVTGPIDVLGTKYSSGIDKRCNCSNVIYELESYAEIAAKGEQDRKAVLGVLMQQILARSIGGDVEKIPQLLETVTKLANHKHIMFFMHNPKVQEALAALNWTGEIKNYDGDFLHINDSNFAGGKSNLYVEQEVTQEISRQGDGIKKKITIEYKNDQPFGVWLNGINRDYVRFYVPKGSKLISSKGSEVPVTTIEDDLGKTVFEAFIQVRPQNSRKLEIEYTISYQPKDEYKLLIQKQPGAKDFHYKIKFNERQIEDFKLDMDKEFNFPL